VAAPAPRPAPKPAPQPAQPSNVERLIAQTYSRAQRDARAERLQVKAILAGRYSLERLKSLQATSLGQKVLQRAEDDAREQLRKQIRAKSSKVK
jgi:hypothetical protein